MSRQGVNYYDNTGYLSSNEYDGLSLREQKLANGQKPWYAYDNYGNSISAGPFWNRYPAGAAKKAATRGLTKILIVSPEGKPYFYIGKRVKINPNRLTEHQYLRGMSHESKVRRATEPEIYELFREILE